jgi:esterase/lipase
MKKFRNKVKIGLVTLLAAYFLGPKSAVLVLDAAAPPIMNSPDFNLAYVEESVAAEDSKLSIRSGNESKLYWADSSGKKTKYVLLYLHGFSASPEEGAPVHLSFAKKYGMNFYAPLLQGHGLVESEPMIDFTAEGFINSAKNAVRIARLMGDSVIIMSTSTGCTAALFLASDADNQIHSLVCYSPNIRVFDKRASLLTGPWGLQIARLVKGGDYNVWEAPEGVEQYWHLKYRLEAVIEMQRLLEATMTKETFEKIECPTFIGYYYKNEEEQDKVVSVPRILEMYEQLGSTKKRKVAFADAGVHAIASDLFSRTTQVISDSTYAFADSVLGVK